MFNFLKDLILDARDTAKERVGNPLLVIFSVFLLINNWQVVLLFFFGDASIPERIAQIECYEFDWIILLISAGETLGYVLIVPWLSLGIQNFQSMPIIRRKEKKIKDETTVAKERKELYIADAENKKNIFGAEWYIKDKEQELEIKKKQAEQNLNIIGERKEFEVERNSLKNQIIDLKKNFENFVSESNKKSAELAASESNLRKAMVERDGFLNDRGVLEARVVQLEKKLLDKQR